MARIKIYILYKRFYTILVSTYMILLHVQYYIVVFGLLLFTGVPCLLQVRCIEHIIIYTVSGADYGKLSLYPRQKYENKIQSLRDVPTTNLYYIILLLLLCLCIRTRSCFARGEPTRIAHNYCHLCNSFRIFP